MKKNILITGANGFLGSFYTKSFLENNNIIAVDKSFSTLKKLTKNKNLILLKCNLSKDKDLKELIKIIKKKKNKYRCFN